MADTVQVPTDLIRIDGGTQPRADGLDGAVFAEYVEALEGGAVFPPVSTFYDGTTHWLADGFHRLAAHVAAGRKSIAAHVTEGTRRDAVLASCAANATHGKQRTRDDKRRAVLTMLADPEWAAMSDREVARRCSVSHPFVSGIRRAEAERRSGNVSSLTCEVEDLRAPYEGRGIGVRVLVFEVEVGFCQVLRIDEDAFAVDYCKRCIRAERIPHLLDAIGIEAGTLAWAEVDPECPALAETRTEVNAWRLEADPWRLVSEGSPNEAVSS